MRKIPLTKGRHAIIDDDDYERVSAYTWCTSEHRNGRVYALTRIKGTGQPGKKMSLHRFIMGAKKGECVDHINRNGLDNRKSNLRIATTSQNARNRPKQSNNTSGYKGVSNWHDGRWQAAVKIHGKRIALGIFSDKKEAALAYDKAAKKYHGEFAMVNFP